MKFMYLILMSCLMVSMGCAAGPEKARAKTEIVKVDVFKKRYQRVGMAETMHATEFLGVKDGVAILQISDMNLLTKGWSKKRIGVKLADLDKAFRTEVEKAAKKLRTD